MDARIADEEGWTGHVPEPLLHDHVDGALGPEQERRVARHLSGCVSCRREAETLRRLTGDLAALPREITPDRDLRPGIADRIAAGRAPGARQALRALRWPLAAAALLLVVGTAWVTTALVDGSGTLGGPGAPGPVAEATRDAAPRTAAAEAAPEIPGLEAAYLPAIRQLAALLERRRSELSPETVRTLEANLRVIDRAIEESRRALADDPGDRVLRELLVGRYEAKVEFLKRATALTAES